MTKKIQNHKNRYSRNWYSNLWFLKVGDFCNLRLVVCCFLASVFIFGVTRSAHASSFQIDPTYTVVQYRIRHLMGHSLGLFKKFDGKIDFDKKNEKLKRLEATIDMTSLETFNPMRDAHLRTEDFFYIDKFPEASFRSTRITADKVAGQLTLRGVRQNVEFSYQYWGTGKDQFGREKVALTLVGTINRQDFGLTYNEQVDGGLLLGDEVEIVIEIQGLLK